jgi:hypothetical protein
VGSEPDKERAFYAGMMIVFLVLTIVFVYEAAAFQSIALGLLAIFFAAFCLYSALKTEDEGD